MKAFPSIKAVNDAGYRLSLGAGLIPLWARQAALARLGKIRDILKFRQFKKKLK